MSEEYKCEHCEHNGEKSVIGNCIKCRDFDRYENEVKKNETDRIAEEDR